MVTTVRRQTDSSVLFGRQEKWKCRISNVVPVDFVIFFHQRFNYKMQGRWMNSEPPWICYSATNNLASVKENTGIFTILDLYVSLR